MIHLGDCVEVMVGMEPESVDAIVTDPPYGLEFMGKEWDRLGATASPFGESLREDGAVDYHGKGNAPFGGGGQRVRYGSSAATMQVWHQAWTTGALRVLKPGGYLLAFGGTRTFHRLTVAIEDAGFEIRDCLSWMYGSGFPKSRDVSKAIDGAAGAPREVVGVDSEAARRNKVSWRFDDKYHAYDGAPDCPLTAPATPEAEQWDGWGTALKPAWEPIIMARKPLIGTVAANVLKHGTGAINVDGCRISTEDNLNGGGYSGGDPTGSFGKGQGGGLVHLQPGDFKQPPGRWPANVVLDEEAAAMLDEQSGEGTLGHHPARRGGASMWAGVGGGLNGNSGPESWLNGGGASRFFYTAKADSEERSRGLGQRNTHPTVKPVSLMTWLVRMVTPPGGTVLDPFLGSGSTAIAAAGCGFQWIGIEKDPEYVAIAEQRLGLFGLTT